MKVKERGYLVRVRCVHCHKEYDILVNREDWDLYCSPNRPHVQAIFPYLSPADREMLISGMCAECWDKLFGDFDEEDDYFDDDEEDCYCE